MNDHSTDKPSRNAFSLPLPSAEDLGISPPKRTSAWIRGLRTLLLTCVAIMFMVAGAAAWWLQNLGVFSIQVEPLLSSVIDHQAQNTIVLDRNGKKIGEFFSQYRRYTPYKDIPVSLRNAIIAIEDRNFFDHKGIDLKAMLRAVRAYIRTGTYSQGGSTLTQQLARSLLLSKEKSIDRKVLEIAYAIQIERYLSKEQIFELYANKMFLGFGAYGVGAASERFFGKSIDKLNIHESALIAGLFQSPSRYDPQRYPQRAKVRQLQVINAMQSAKFIDAAQARALKEKPLKYIAYQSINEQLAPHFIDYVREQANDLLKKRIEDSGLIIHTTLDSNLQQIANKTYEHSSEHFAYAENMILANQGTERPRIESAMLSIDPRTGEILAMVGGRSYENSQFNRSVQALRSPGSAFKPVVYSLALSRGRKWSDVLLVSPISIEGYKPRNFGNEFLAETTMLRAFYQSLNTATVEIGSKYRLDDIITYAQKLGIRSPIKAEAGLMLGASELTMLDLARMYGSFANHGIRSEIEAISKITDRGGKVLYQVDDLSKRQFEATTPENAFLITEGLRAVMKYGTAAKAGHLSEKAVGKTGTSNDSIDNWFCGYTPNLLTLTWVGTDQRLPLQAKATGGSLALPLWDNFMTQAIAQRSITPVTQPAGISVANVDARYGYATPNGVRMYFYADQKPMMQKSDFQHVEETGSVRSLYGH